MSSDVRHILVPSDFSETAQAALNYAYDFAKITGAKLTLLHVVNISQIRESLSGLDAMENLTAAMNLPSSHSPYTPSLYDFRVLESSAHKKLEHLVDPAWRAHVDVSVACVEGRPSQAIVSFAQNNDVDLIIIGTHGRGAMSQLLLGSVADNVIRQSEVPVLTVRRQKKPAAGVSVKD